MRIKVNNNIVTDIDKRIKYSTERYGVKPNLLSLTPDEYKELKRYKGNIKHYCGMKIEVGK